MSLYLYGVVQGPEEADFGPVGLRFREGKPAAIHVQSYQGIGIVYSDAQVWQLDRANKQQLTEALLDHQKALETIMKQKFILPIKFGTMVSNLESIQAVLKTWYSPLQKAVSDTHHLIEINLSVTWDVGVQLKRFLVLDTEIQQMKQQAEVVKTPEAMVAVGKCLEEKLHAYRDGVAKNILTQIQHIALDWVEHERVEGDRMVLSVSWLVDKKVQDVFFEVINQLDMKYEGHLNFKCIAPLPLHSFKTIVIQQVETGLWTMATKLFKITPTTTLKDIKQRNRELIQKYHPDKRGGQSRETFETILKCYDLFCELYRDHPDPLATVVSMTSDNACFLVKVEEAA